MKVKVLRMTEVSYFLGDWDLRMELVETVPFPSLQRKGDIRWKIQNHLTTP